MQQIVLAARPIGEPKLSDFRFVTIPMPTPGPGQLLIRAVWLSLDPYMRGRMDEGKSYAAAVAIGMPMEGGCVGEVIASNNPLFAVGDFVENRFGWRSHALSDGKGVRKLDADIAPLSTAIGVLGMPGFTAYIGLNLHGMPQKGETIVVGAATGAVGSLVGQLARIQGLRTVGVAGGKEKCDYAVKVLGFDACLDHRSAADAPALSSKISAECPNGVDIYFENTGGKTFDAVLPLINVHGRIPLCGMISLYNNGALRKEPAEGVSSFPKVWRTLLVNRIKVHGFIITDHYDQFPKFIGYVAPLIQKGEIIYKESITIGLEKAPQAFIELLRGENFGKQLVSVSGDTTRC